VADLFVYGTLREKSLLCRLTGKDFSATRACLEGFRKFTSRFGYPYVVPRKGFKVVGRLIRDVDEQSLKKLDQYENEGRSYSRKKVIVIAAGKKTVCEVYVGNEKVLR